MIGYPMNLWYWNVSCQILYKLSINCNISSEILYRKEKLKVMVFADRFSIGFMFTSHTFNTATDKINMR